MQRRQPNSNPLTARMSALQTNLWTRWQELSARDQLALSILSLFLILLIGGYGGYQVHKAAKDSKADYQQHVTDYFWLRSQASNIDSSALAGSIEGANVPSASSINTLLNNSGINDAQVVSVGENVQFSFTYPSQATVSSALNALEQQGWQFSQLTIQQDAVTKQLQVQATVTL